MATQATTTQKKRALTYLNRDFESFKQDIVENYIKIYYPNTFQDFNDSSLGMMLVDLMAYFGDNLSYYLDKKFAESFIETAQEPANVFKHARQQGFKAFGKTSAFGNVNFIISLPATTVNGQLVPDMRYAGIVSAGATVKSESGQTFETLENADFSTVDITDPTVVSVSNSDPLSKMPTSYAIMLQNVGVQAGQTSTTTFTITSYQPFLNLTIADTDVLEILSVVDSQNNTWYEVDYLAQDTVFDSLPNTGADSTEVPFVLVLRTVPYRFITQYDATTGLTSLVFGTGDGSSLDQDLIPNLGDLSIPAFGKQTFAGYSIDPQNFLKTRTLGLAPVNTTLTVTYRTGGGVNTNAGALQLNSIANAVFNVADNTLDQSIVRGVGNSLEVMNPTPAQGGSDELDISVIKQLVSANFAAQDRAVTAPDFIARALSMPAKYGSVFRANPRAGQINRNSVELTILSQDSNGNVAIASPTLKQNLQKYLSKFRMLTDAIELLDGKIINIGINFSVLTSPDYNRSQVLTDCLNQLVNFFDVNVSQIGAPINITNIQYLLADVDGVLSVYDVSVVNLAGIISGRQYSQSTYNIAKNTQNNIVYCDDNAIFSVLYPQSDIIGTAK